MGTYTTNYQLFMPTVGEQGWGELVNGNFSTIDTTMEGLDTRIGTLETETDAVEERVTVLEKEIDFAGLSITMPTLTYNPDATATFGLPNSYYTENQVYLNIFSSPFPVSGKIRAYYTNGASGSILCIGPNGSTTFGISTTDTEYTVTNVTTIMFVNGSQYQAGSSFVYYTPMLSNK